MSSALRAHLCSRSQLATRLPLIVCRNVVFWFYYESDGGVNGKKVSVALPAADYYAANGITKLRRKLEAYLERQFKRREERDSAADSAAAGASAWAAGVAA